MAGIRAVLAAIVFTGCIALPSLAFAQLRPLDPIDWRFVDGTESIAGALGGAVYRRQRASLAGVEGRLLELGNLLLHVRIDRIILEAGGTVFRRMDRQWTRQEPTGGALVDRARGPNLTDVGDFRLATIVPLLHTETAALALRFGARLPTTDNQVGLERDQTDFFALIGGRMAHGGFRFETESGVGIHGTRSPNHEQLDVLLYAFSLGYFRDRIGVHLGVLGQESGQDWTIRGNEDLNEARFGIRLGGSRWAEVALVRGLAPFSPRSGLLLSAGIAR